MQNHASQSSKIASCNLCDWSQEYNIFTSEPGTYYNRRRWKPFFSFIQTLTWLQPIISARKCANTTEKMSSCYWSTAHKKTETLTLKVMSNSSEMVSPLTAYLHVHVSFCMRVYTQVLVSWVSTHDGCPECMPMCSNMPRKPGTSLFPPLCRCACKRALIKSH